MIKTGMPSMIGKISFSPLHISVCVAVFSDKGVWQLGQAKGIFMR
jgi:hypothetical protein